jgi:hypothetical protein
MQASRSSSWTISIGECMFRSGIETSPVGIPSREAKVTSASE